MWCDASILRGYHLRWCHLWCDSQESYLRLKLCSWICLTRTFFKHTGSVLSWCNFILNLNNTVLLFTRSPITTINCPKYYVNRNHNQDSSFGSVVSWDIFKGILWNKCWAMAGASLPRDAFASLCHVATPLVWPILPKSCVVWTVRKLIHAPSVMAPCSYTCSKE